jgi:predicted PurR-regulated permease PerM
LAAVIAAVALLLYAIRYALLPFVFAIAVAFVLEPVVRFLQRGRHRWPGAIAIYAGLLLVGAAGFYWFGTVAAADIAQFAQRAPQIAHDLLVQTVGPRGVSLFGQSYPPDQIVAAAGAMLRQIIGPGLATGAAGIAAGGLFGGFLLLVLIPYFMISGPRLAAGAIWLIPPERRASVEALLPRILPVLRRYLVGILLVVTYTALIAWLGFGPVFKLPHSVLLAITVGVLEIIPAVGPLASASLVSLTAFEQQSLAATLTLIGFVILLRLSIDNLVGPIVLGQAARLHPVVVIFAFVCGAMLFGVIGLLLAVPTAVCLKVTLQHYYAEPIRADGSG